MSYVNYTIQLATLFVAKLDRVVIVSIESAGLSHLVAAEGSDR